MRQYRGVRVATEHHSHAASVMDGGVVLYDDGDGPERLPLYVRATNDCCALSMRTSTNTTFNWGDNGPNAYALASSLLAHAVGVEASEHLTRAFLGAVISSLPTCWTMTADDIAKWVEEATAK